MHLLAPILVTGGTGFIGSHTVVELAAAGYPVVLLDNFANSRPEVLGRLARITGADLPFHQGDVRDRALLDRIFRAHRIGTVIHFAGLKAVEESARDPLAYYRTNVAGSLELLGAMAGHGCRRLVFSSSATVYGEPAVVPVREDAPLGAANPYGRTKVMVEDLCRDLAASEPGWHVALLRYFNPVGAHPSGLLGEEPPGMPNNLMPYLLQVATGRRECLSVFGADYPTRDGTGVRDYLHVVDLARGHVAALEALPRLDGAVPVNLGTGRGTTVLELVAALSKVLGRPVPHRFAPRRPGDCGCVYADASLAVKLLGWRAERDLEAMCRDAWRWQCALDARAV
jgi:UDP-glucose 4-epimerase